MSDVFLNVEFLGGEHIKTASAEACALATRIGVNITFNFNEVRCTAYPHGEPEILVANWERAVREKQPYKFANNRDAVSV